MSKAGVWDFFACFFSITQLFQSIVARGTSTDCNAGHEQSHFSVPPHFLVNIDWKSLLSLFTNQKTFTFFREWDCIPVFNIMKSELFMAGRAISGCGGIYKYIHTA